MNKLKSAKFLVVTLFLSFLISMSLTSCGNQGSKEGDNTEVQEADTTQVESSEHPEGESEHPNDDSEHPTGDETDSL